MNVPVYAVLGHPNEGKSSVVSTLTENDRVRISSTPGETVVCATSTIDLDGRPALRIVDTPGFQNPAATLKWFEAWEGPEGEMVDAFRKAHADHPDFHHDVELMAPLLQHAGILYVADASRPLREADRQEMEVLRLTGLPRLALLNFKQDNREYVDQWKEALSRRFNLVREFNAHRASFNERMALFDALAQLTPERETALHRIQERLREDWNRRREEAVLILETLWVRVIRHQVRRPFDDTRPEAPQLAEAREHYQQDLRKFEQRARAQWRGLYQHPSLPAGGGVEEVITGELFAEKIWRLLGLTRRQLAVAGAVTGGAVGAGVDVAAGGITFGVFTAGGAVLGGLSGWLGGPRLGARRLPLPGHRTLAREHVEVGPFADPQLLFVLLDRALLYIIRLMNWAHGRRDTEAFLEGRIASGGLVRSWSDAERNIALRWIKTHTRPGHPDAAKTSEALRKLLDAKLAT